jgi:hypothetical protein
MAIYSLENEVEQYSSRFEGAHFEALFLEMLNQRNLYLNIMAVILAVYVLFYFSTLFSCSFEAY